MHQLVLRSLATTGHLPASEEINKSAAAYGRTGAEVLADLQKADFLQLDAQGGIKQLYPFSLTPTPHRVQIEGGPLMYAMCAIDALGIAAMLNAATKVTSTDSRTGEPVTANVKAGGHQAIWSPATIVVFNGHKTSSCEPADACTSGRAAAAADCRCGSMIFFTSLASATVWTEAHRELSGEILDGPEALQLGCQIFGSMLATSA